MMYTRYIFYIDDIESFNVTDVSNVPKSKKPLTGMKKDKQLYQGVAGYISPRSRLHKAAKFYMTTMN